MEEGRREEEGEEEDGEEEEEEEGEEGLEEGEKKELDAEMSKSTLKSRTKLSSSSTKSKHTGTCMIRTCTCTLCCSFMYISLVGTKNDYNICTIHLCAGYKYGHIPWADADITVLVDERGVPKFCLQELSTKVCTCTHSI